MQTGTHPLEDGPQHCALRFRYSCFSPEAHDIAISLPICQLPRIHHLLPLGEEKSHAKLMTGHRARSLLHQLAHDLMRCNRHRADICSVEPKADRIERIDVDPFRQPRLAAQKSFQLNAKGAGEGVREGRQQQTRVRLRAGQMCGSMQRNDGFSSAGRAGDASRAREVALDPGPLLRMKKDRPFVPRIIQRAFQFLSCLDQAETALGIRVLKWARRTWRRSQ